MGIQNRSDGILSTFAAQMPNNPMQKAVLVTESGKSDKILEEFRQLQNGKTKVEVVNVDGLVDLKTDSQDLVFINNLANKKTNELNKILQESLRVLQSNGATIVCENMDSLPTKAIADLSTLFDSYTSVVDKVDKSFKLYCMNQFEDTENGKIGVYWILETFSGKNDILDENNEKMTRSFLDKTQYTEENISAYEWIFGKDFISPGGVDENRRMMSHFDEMEEGKRMLDIGCGIGGSPRQVSRELQMNILACDISANMVSFAIGRSNKNPDRRVSYQLADAVEYKFDRDSFDYVYSRDCIQHISELPKLFKNIYNCLKTGGQLIVTMYGKGKGQLTNEFLEYVKDRKYALRSLDEVVQIANDAGFNQVEGENMTKRFEEILHKERQKAITHQEKFLELFSAKKYEGLLAGWEQKLRFINDDNHNWLKIKCTK